MISKKPTTQEVIEAYETLSKFGRVTMTKDILKDNEAETLDSIAALIRSLGSFNEKDGGQIAREFRAFFKSLPRAYYQEGNPNNGKPLFDKIQLRGDDYIILEAHGFKNYMQQYDTDAIKEIVWRKGIEWRADVHDLIIEEDDAAAGFSTNMVYFQIRFWWD